MRLRTNVWLLLSALPPAVLMLCAVAAPPKKAAPAPATTTFEHDVVPLVNKYCVGCHTGKEPAGGILLTGYTTTATMIKGRSTWERVAENVASSHMPPMEVPKPTQAERDTITHFIESTLSKADCKLNDPGRITMRRLNRAEYNNTVHDLTGVSLRPADSFPSDDVGYGFDNIGDVLSLSPLLMEKYLTAAEKVARAAIRTPEDTNRPVLYSGKLLANAGGNPHNNGGQILMSEGEVGVEHDFLAPGDYEFNVQAEQQAAGPDPARMTFRLGGHDVRTFDVKALEGKPQVYSIKAHIAPGGKQRFAAAFINDYYNTDSPDLKLRGDRNLIIDSIEIKGPLGAKGIVGDLPESHRKIITCKPQGDNKDACGGQILTTFARRAYRRPVTKVEVSRLLRCAHLAWDSGESFEKGIQLGIQAALVSPNFLFRVEVDPKANNPKAKRAVNDFELASRLSYFLWSSMPDDRLLALAQKGELHKPQVLAAQAKRMLKDPRAKSLSDNFAGQWLQLRKLNIVNPDHATFPTWNENLRTAMRTETEMFFQGIVSNDRSVLEFLDSDYTYLNETLAKHYGNPNVKGEMFRRVALHGGQRGGLLSQASVLTVTSNPTRTSPVKRGKWVLDNILGTPPPPPPPNVGQLPDDNKKAVLTGTLRQRLEQHRKKPICASCHQRMDPIGFGLENYNAIGAWRAMDGGLAVDSSGTLPGGKSFRGPKQLKAILMGKKSQFVHALSEKLLTYALGRGIEPYDRCNIDTIAQATTQSGYRFSALVAAIVQSKPFRERRGDGGS